MKTSSHLLMSTILAGFVLIDPAHAQDTAVTVAPTAAPTVSQNVPAEQNGIADIIVTAQKRADTIQSVPVAVTALDQKALDSASIKDLRDFAGRVPSLVVDSVAAGPGAAAISIRGISFEDIEKSFDPAVGVVVDGVFIGTNTGQLFDSFDLQRIEILRGPQGTLFGRNTIGGVINITRTRPTKDTGLRSSFAYSSFNTKKGRLVANTGTIGDVLALKAFVLWDKTDGYYHNVTKNRREGRYETLTGGVTALLTPAAGISALLTYEHMRERGETVVASLSETGKDLICLAPGAPGFAPAVECDRQGLPNHGLYTTFENIATPVRNDTDALTANVDIDLGSGFSFSSVTGYRHNKESVRQDFDASSAKFFDTLRNQTYHQFSQEARIVGNVTPWLNLLVGGYYFNSGYKIDQFTNFGLILSGGSPFVLQQFVEHHSKSYAGFGDARIKLSDAFSIGVGARYTEDDKRIFNNYGRIASLVRLSQPSFDGTGCVQVIGLLVPGVPAYGPATNCSGSAKFGKFTWRANANYKLDEHKLLYISYSKGFRSGGFNGRAASPTSLGPYQPETVDAYEAGLKADWLDRRLRTNFAIYQTKYNNKQEETVQPSPPGASNPQETVVKNASKAKISGFEAEITAQPVNNLTLRGSFSYTHAKYNSFFNDVNGDLVPDDVSTLTLRRAPKYQGSVGLDYNQDLGSGRLEFSTTLRYQSAYQTCIAPARPRIIGQIHNDERCLTSGREDLGAQLSYLFRLRAGNEVKVSVFGSNLTNNRGLASALPVAGLLTFGTAKPPRSIGAEIGVKF